MSRCVIVSARTYPYRPHVLALGARVPAQPALQPAPRVQRGLGRRHHVEGRRRRAALLEIADPQLAAGELPLHVGALLYAEHN